MGEQEDTGMDTTYVGIMLVVFLVIAALAIDIGYMFVSEDDLHSAAETSALAGAQAMKQRVKTQVTTDPKGLGEVLADQVQQEARTAAAEMVSGHHKASALIDIASNNTNRLTTGNDMTVGFWNTSSQTYTPGATPVNAVQVRTRRTAESESVGLGSIGSFLSTISGPQKLNYTPEAIAAFPPRADTNFAICEDACGTACVYPDVCNIPERKMVRDPWDPRKDPPAVNRYAYTTLLYQPSAELRLSDLICMEIPPQEVCGKQIYTIRDADNSALRDMESIMYNPNIDKFNKEYDKAGNLLGWWVIAPVTECPPATQDKVFETHRVTRYSLVRISRICATGSTGCSQNGTAFDAPASVCRGEEGLFIDRISCVNCGSKAMLQFPGLHPVLVK